MQRLALAASLLLACAAHAFAASPTSSVPAQVDRSPVDLAVTSQNDWIVTANQTSNSISLIDAATLTFADERPCGARPTTVKLSHDGKRAFVVCSDAGTVEVFDLNAGKLSPAGKIELGFEPIDIAFSPDESRGYVSLSAANQIAVIDAETLKPIERLEVGSWPRYLAISSDGKTLAVGCTGERAVDVVDLETGKVRFKNEFTGIVPGRTLIPTSNSHVYFPWMTYRSNPIDQRTVRLGWVLGSRIARVRLDQNERREAITLDPPGQAVSDPHGIALSPDEQWLVTTGSGTHELLAYKLPGLPFQSTGGPGDHMDRALQNDRERFFRIDLGGRPMGVALSNDGRRAFVANYLNNSVQVVDLDARAIWKEISLGGPALPSLAREGEAIFYDARRSLDQWYSCHSCHYDGGTSVVPMDTWNDGTPRTFKTTPILANVTRTGPWMWHGWQTDLRASLKKSITETMLGPPPSEHDIDALTAWLETLEPRPNPHRGKNTEQVERGLAIFNGAKAACSSCHSGEYFTDGKIHDVGLGSEKDVYDGFNTPSLIGVYRKVRLLHAGQARSLEEVVTGLHKPSAVSGGEDLTSDEVADLVAYLKTL